MENFGIFLFFSILFALFVYFLSFVLKSRQKKFTQNAVQEQVYTTKEDKKISLEPKFLTFAIILLLFETLCVLILPFACVIRVLDASSIIKIIFFVIVFTLICIFCAKLNLLKLD